MRLAIPLAVWIALLWVTASGCDKTIREAGHGPRRNSPGPIAFDRHHLAASAAAPNAQ
jgi:hypothetical protein